MKTLNDFNFNNKKAIIRVDFNVPLDENFKVTDATRIEAAKPTIDKILKDGGSVILMSHLGRPKGVEAKYSLQHIVSKTEEILGQKVHFASDCIGEIAENACKNVSFSVQSKAPNSRTDFVRIRDNFLECYPITGKKHQIRSHLAFMQLPILNDTMYGGKKLLSVPKHTIFLHCNRIIVDEIEITAALPAYFLYSAKFC